MLTPLRRLHAWGSFLGRREFLRMAVLGACNLTACNGEVPAEAVNAERVLSQYEYFGLMSDLPFDVPRVLHWLGPAEGAQIDGEPALLAEPTTSNLKLRFLDTGGRTLRGQLVQEPGEPTYFLGVVRRCIDGHCEEGNWELRPLSSTWSEESPESEASSPVGFDAPAGYDLVGELSQEEASGDGANVVVSEGVAYVSGGRGGVRIVDVGTSQTPRVLASLRPTDANEVWNDVKIVARRWLLIASSERGLVLFDVSVPRQPVLVHDGFPGTRSNVHTIHVAGERLYLARVGRFGGLSVVDISQLPALRLEGDVSLPGCNEVHEALFDGVRLFASCLSDGLRLYDVSDASMPRELGSFPQSGSHSSARLGESVILTSREGFALPLEVLSVKERDVTEVSRLASGFAASPHNLFCQSSRCWVAHHQEGLVEVNIDRPEAPIVAARFPTWEGPGHSFLEGASGVFVELPWVYVADNVRGLLILRRWE